MTAVENDTIDWNLDQLNAGKLQPSLKKKKVKGMLQIKCSMSFDTVLLKTFPYRRVDLFVGRFTQSDYLTQLSNSNELSVIYSLHSIVQKRQVKH